MEIFIYDIPEEGRTFRLNSTKDAWLRSIVVKALGDAFGDEDSAQLELTLMRNNEDIDIVGELEIISHPTCDRCLSEYREEVSVPIHSHMTPLYESERQREREIDEGMDKELVKEDLEFSFYEGDRIYLDDFISEQVVLAQPMKHLCDEECKGLCQTCGKNLNEGPCNCEKATTDPRWNTLKNLKLS